MSEDWAEETKGIIPIRSKPRHLASHKPKRKTFQAIEPRLEPSFTDLPPLNIETPTGIARGTLKRLKRGAVEIDYKLDLHGYTQERAFNLLCKTLARVKHEGGRTVLVITGKGKPDKESVLRQALKQWVNLPELRPHIISLTEAPQYLGGSGAFLLFLSRLQVDP